MGIPNILLGLCVFFAVLKRVNKHSFFFNNKPLKIILVLIFYLILVFTIKGELFSNLSMIGRLLIIPVFLILLLKGNSENIIKSFWFSYILLTVLVFIKINIYYFVYGDLKFNTIKEFHTLLFIDRPYFGFVSLVGIILSIKYFEKHKKYKFLIYSISIISFALIYIVAARLTMLTVFILCLVFVFKKIRTSILKKTIILFVLSFGFVTSLVLNKNFINRLVVNQGVTSFMDYEPRFVIWPCTTKIISENTTNIIVGFGGFTETQKQLCECYEKNIDNESKRSWYLERKFNTHNQFLGFLLIGGVISLIIFTYLLYQLFLESYMNIYLFSIWISFVLFLIFENIFYRQYGCYLVAIIIIFLTQKNNEKNKSSTYS